MKTVFALLSLTLLSLPTTPSQEIEMEDLESTCKVLSSLTGSAIDDNRKDLVVLYYNAYKSIRSDYEINEGCDGYFDAIQDGFIDDTGEWFFGLGTPPKLFIPEATSGGGWFTHKEVQALYQIKEMELTLEDLNQVMLIKEYQKNRGFDIKKLKENDLETMKDLKIQLNQLDLERIDLQRK